MTNPELQAKDHVDTKEEKLLQKEAKDTDLSAHQDLIDMIAYKYAGKAGAENKDDQDGKDLYKGDISEKDAKQVLVPFQGLAKAFGVPFVKDILSSPLYDVKYEDIVAMDKELSTSLQNREIILIQNELNALKQVIQMPGASGNEYKDIADFASKQQAESWSVEEYMGNENISRKNASYSEKEWVGDMLDKIPNIDGDSKNNIHNELKMNSISTSMDLESKSIRKGLTSKYKDEFLKYHRDNGGKERDAMRKTYKNSDLTPTPNVPTFDDFYYNKIKTTEEATLNALNNIQKSDAPYILHEVSLFMVPGELRKFVNENLNSNPKQIETSLKSAIEADINKIHAEKGDKTIEQVISDRILQLSKEDQKKIVEYAKMKEITLAGRNYGGTVEGKNLTEGVKGFIAQIAEIIKAIFDGFADVWGDIASNPDMKAALTSLGIFNVEKMDAMLLKKDGEMLPVDSTVSAALKKDLFNSGNTEDCLSNMFNEGASTRSVSEATSKEYIKNNKGTASSPQEHILDTILAVMHKDSAADQKKELRDDTGEFNMNKVDGKYKEYKNHMIDTVWAGQNIRWKDMGEDQQQEMISRSLAKNNSASLLYYKETVLPELQKLDTKKATDAALAKANTEVEAAKAQSTTKESEKPATTTP